MASNIELTSTMDFIKNIQGGNEFMSEFFDGWYLVVEMLSGLPGSDKTR